MLSPELAQQLKAERDRYKAVLEYVASPTMGRPSDADPVFWAMDGALEWDARRALQTCITMAKDALAVTAQIGRSVVDPK